MQPMYDEKCIYVVTGLPRSGTSMMMQILEAGGIEILTDGEREADDDNPRGYYEVEKVKQIQSDASFMEFAVGKAIKIITKLLVYIPDQYRYKIIFVRRKMSEVLASQKKMLIRNGVQANSGLDNKLAQLFERHLSEVNEWIGKQPHIDVINVNHIDVIRNPENSLKDIIHFLNVPLDLYKMINSVDKNLYRQVH